MHNNIDLSGQQLGNYRLIELLGEGGMGSVYRAVQIGLEREVAVKVLPRALSQKPDFVTRFEREARTVASLDEHPNIISIIEYGTDQGISFVVMPLMAGGSLSQRINTGEPYTLDQIADLIEPLASALDFAHQQGIVHRDIKPDNILFNSLNAPFITDFGIAKILQADVTSLTAVGAAVGTPTFMAPEQWRGEGVTPATDQYALAVVVFLLVTGQLPFEATTPQALMYKHLHETPQPPNVLHDDVPVAVSSVLLRALSKNPTERYPSIVEFAAAFRAALSISEPEPQPEAHPTPQRPRLMDAVSDTPTIVPPEDAPPSSNRAFRYGCGALAAIVLLAVAAIVIGALLIEDSPDTEDANPTEIADNPSPTILTAIADDGDDSTTTLTATVPPSQEPIETLIAQANANDTATAAIYDTQTATVFTTTPTDDVLATVDFFRTATASSWTQTPSNTPNNTVTPSPTITNTPTSTQTATNTNTATNVPPPTDLPSPTNTDAPPDLPIVSNRLVIGMSDQTFSLDPANVGRNHEIEILSNISEGFLGFAPGTNTLEPRLAVDFPTVSADGLTYTFTLRDNLFFGNNTPITAESMVRTIQRNIDVAEFVPEVASAIYAMQAIDDTTVVITLDAPNPTFALEMAASPMFYAFSENTLPLDLAVDIPGIMYGAGRYQMVDYDLDERVLLQLNPAYRGSIPDFTEIEILFFASSDELTAALTRGDVDMAWHSMPYAQVDAYLDAASFDVATAPLFPHFLMLNHNISPNQLAPVRQAIAQLIDRESMLSVADANSVAPMYSMAPDGAFGASDVFRTLYPVDIDAAAEALLILGYSSDNPLIITLHYPGTRYGDWVPRALDIFAEYVSATGVATVEWVVNEEFATYINSAANGELALYMLRNGQGIPDVDSSLEWIALCDGSFSSGVNYCSDSMTALFAESRSLMFQPEERAAVLELMQVQFAEDVVGIPLWTSLQHAVYNNTVVSGLQFTRNRIIEYRTITAR